MDAITIENAILEIMSECEMFTESSPLTYLILLERYSHMLNEIQINNVKEIIENLKTRMNIINEINMKKFTRNNDEQEEKKS
jgi:hypothetical protein